MRCPKCKAELKEDVVFCTNCGIKLESYLKWSPDYQEPPKKDADSRSANPEFFEKANPGKTFENFEEPGSIEPEDFTEEEEKESQTFQKFEPEERASESLQKPKQEKEKASSFDETFYQQKERFHVDEFLKKHFRGILKTALILVVVLLAVRFVYNTFFAPLDSVIAVYDENEGEYSIYLNSKKVGTINGSVQIFDNMDRSAFYMIDGASTGWYLKGKELVKIMEDCQYVVTANHDKTALLVDKKNRLYRYDGSELEKITEKEVHDIAVSGNGDSYAYTIYDKNGYATYIGKKPDKEEKVENVRIAAISEKGDYVYAIGKGDNLICIDKKGNEKTLGEGITVIGGKIVLNEKGTEIMFVMNQKTYISVKGNDKEEVADGIFRDVYGRQTGNTYAYPGDCIFYPVDSFRKSAMSVSRGSDLDVYLISDSYEGERIVMGVSKFYGTNKKVSRIYYTRNSSIYSAQAREDAEEEKLTENLDIYYACHLKDSEEVYFITEDSRIGCVRKNGEIEYADIEIDRRACTVRYAVEQGIYIQSNDKFFYISGERVWELKNITDLVYDEFSKKMYAYTATQVYSVKNGKMRKLRGDFHKIVHITLM